jgi:hypothetical protein
MTMSFRHNRNGKGVRPLRVVAYAMLFAMLIGVDSLSGGLIRGTTRSVLSPLTTTFAEVISLPIREYVTSKRELIARNGDLEREIASLKQSGFANELALSDVATLCSLTPPMGEKPATKLTTHIATPIEYQAFARVAGYEQSFFGSISIIFTDERRPLMRSIALDENNVPLGFLTEAQGRSGVVTLFTAAHTKTEVRIKGAVTTMEGEGGTTLSARLPLESKVVVGDPVVLTSLGLPLGTVGEVQKNPADAEMHIYIQPRFSLASVRFVNFVKPN